MGKYEELKDRLIAAADSFEDTKLSDLLDDARYAIMQLESALESARLENERGMT
jgi:hypothetical protein